MSALTVIEQTGTEKHLMCDSGTLPHPLTYPPIYTATHFAKHTETGKQAAGADGAETYQNTC